MPFAYDAASTVPDAATAAAAAEAAAVAAGYPTQEMYLANKDWYNSQGYYGLTPAGTPAPAPATAAAPQAATPAPAASGADPGMISLTPFDSTPPDIALIPSMPSTASARSCVAPSDPRHLTPDAVEYAKKWEQYYAMLPPQGES